MRKGFFYFIKNMAKDPAFLFYPGDYLRDTQCLSESAQVAYDRIMCEHMRNISIDMNNIVISKAKHNFFTKRLTDDEKEELSTVLIQVGENYQIEWVARSMAERKEYTDSRSRNRIKGKKNTDQKPSIISNSYEKHMEDEDENEDKDEIKSNNEIKKQKKSKTKILAPELNEVLDYFKQNGYSEIAAKKAFEFYEAAKSDGKWFDSNGKEVKNWKQKMQGVWFKDENKIQKLGMAQKVNPTFDLAMQIAGPLNTFNGRCEGYRINNKGQEPPQEWFDKFNKEHGTDLQPRKIVETA